MSLETRHTEKNILFMLLTAETSQDFDKLIKNLMAIMEPEDVELVQKRVAEYKKTISNL
ncbi:MAG: hypothetical protein FWG90_10555 [Oscillospiraceae bacterium]|nr:hypothetical protein [Oscillospiraceae bacterium]